MSRRQRGEAGSLLRAFSTLGCVALALMSAPFPAQAHQHRSHAEKAAFQREHPCPSTGERRGRCPGYVIDHHQALCVGGADRSENMRWMTIAAARAKDRWECRPGWQRRLQECEAQRAC